MSSSSSMRGPLEKALADLAALAQATGTLPSLAAAHQHATKQLDEDGTGEPARMG